MDKALTVIMPAYNVSRYLEQGLDSLLAEKSILTCLDIIVVNDGSNDDTLEKAEKYCKQYPESVRVIDKDNGGHGSGINVGIKAARGKYLKVLDGDDWVKSEGLKQLVEYITEESESPDAIVNPFEKVWEDGSRENIDFKSIAAKSTVSFNEINQYGYTLPLHTLTIRTSIYRENEIPQIDEKISYDDMEYILYPIPYINSIVFLSATVYEYRLGMQEQSMNPRQMVRKLPMHTKVIESLAKYYRENMNIFDNEQKKYFMKEFVDTLATNCEIRIRAKQDFKALKKFICQYSDFDIYVSRSKTLKVIYRFGYAGYLFIIIYRCIKG